jgi:hypothetical protein
MQPETISENGTESEALEPREGALDPTTEWEEITALLGDNDTEAQKYQNRLDSRDCDEVPAKWISEKRIGPADSVVPMRRIQTVIAGQKGPMVSYLTQSRRILLFQDPTQPLGANERIEIEFAKLVKYEGWRTPWEELVDGVLTHGADFMELRFSPSSPCKFKLEYVQRRHLIFPQDCISLASLQWIGRIFEKTCHEIKQDARFAEGASIIERHLGDKKSYEKVKTYRIWKKTEEGLVEFWYLEGETGEFLAKPQPVDLGIKLMDPVLKTELLQPPTPAPVMDFPLWVCSIETRYMEILKYRGLVYGVLPFQEAETVTWTAIINRTRKAAALYANTDNPEGHPATCLELQPDTIQGGKINYFSPPMPDPSILNTVQSLSREAYALVGSTNSAVMARQDSRKTAEEMRAAQNMNSLLSMISTLPLAATIVNAYSLGFQISKSQILLGTIEVQDQAPWLQPYSFAAAGEVDYQAREDKKMLLRELLPQLQSSSIGKLLLKMMVTTFLPEEAPKLIGQMEQEDQMQAQLMAMAQVLSALPVDVVPPEARQQFITIQNVARQLTGTPLNASQPQGVAEQPADPNLSQ